MLKWSQSFDDDHEAEMFPESSKVLEFLIIQITCYHTTGISIASS